MTLTPLVGNSLTTSGVRMAGLPTPIRILHTRQAGWTPPPWQTGGGRSVQVRLMGLPTPVRLPGNLVVRAWGSQMSSGTITVHQNTLNIHVEAGVVEYEPPTTPPTLFTARGKDITVEIGPTRLSTVIDSTRTRAQVDIADTRGNWTDVGQTRLKWAVDPNTRDASQVDVADTRTSTDIGPTRVQRNRS